MAGQVRVDGQVVVKPATTVSGEFHAGVGLGPALRLARRRKTGGGLRRLCLSTVKGCVCADVGASTGGFTDCLLQHGAAKVYAIDVGKGILHWKLRSDPRVVVMEETNARYVESLPEPVQPGDDRRLVYFVEDLAAGGEEVDPALTPIPSPNGRGA